MELKTAIADERIAMCSRSFSIGSKSTDINHASIDKQKRGHERKARTLAFTRILPSSVALSYVF